MERGQFGTALITGASSGIGAVFARKLAEQGNKLVLVARRQERLEKMAGELQALFGVEIIVLAADLTEPQGIEKAADCITALSDLGLLVNNAGFGATGNFIGLPYQQHADMITVHVLATVRLTHAALPGMLERGKGSVINVSSISAFMPVGSGSTYGPTKAYLNSFSQLLHFELDGRGVRIQALCPGFTRTEFHDDPSFASMKKGIPGFMWMEAGKVVQGSLEALEKGKVIYVPGMLNRLIVLLGRTGAIGMLAPLVRRILGT